MLLNTADALRAGSAAVDAVYLGAAQVWPTGDPGGPVDATVTIPAGKVASTLTNFPVRVDLADMPTAWWDDVATDGGNVRVKQGGTAIPFDLVVIDTAAQTGELYFKAPSLTTSDNAFTLDKSGDALLAATDPNGRNAVWADYELFTIPGAEAVNRRTGTALTVSGTPPIVGPTWKSPTVTAHDGITSDGTHWYSNTDSAIHKYDAAFNLVASNTDPDAGVGVTMTSMSDTCVVGDELFAAMGGTAGRAVVVFDAATLTYKRHHDISSTEWSPASLCFNPADGYFYSVGFQAGTNVATLIQKWDTSFNLVGTLATASIVGKQGIEVWDGYFWITGNNNFLYRVNLDGSGMVQASNVGLDRVLGQGLTVHDGALYVLNTGASGSDAEVYRLEYASAEHYHIQNNYLRIAVAKFTDWTWGASVFMSKGAATTRCFMSYGTNDTSTTTKEFLQASSVSNAYTMVSSVDSLSDPTVTPLSQDRYRWNGTMQGTTEKKMWRNGVARASKAGVSNRPTGASSVVFMGAQHSGGGAIHFGSLSRIYLRGGVLSADWLAAETVSWETPASFYAVT